MLGMVFQARVEPTPAGSRLIVRMDLRPRGLARLGSPILRRVMQREEVRNLAAIKRTLEAGPGTHAPQPDARSSRGGSDFPSWVSKCSRPYRARWVALTASTVFQLAPPLRIALGVVE